MRCLMPRTNTEISPNTLWHVPGEREIRILHRTTATTTPEAASSFEQSVGGPSRDTHTPYLSVPSRPSPHPRVQIYLFH